MFWWNLICAIGSGKLEEVSGRGKLQYNVSLEYCIASIINFTGGELVLLAKSEIFEQDFSFLSLIDFLFVCLFCLV